MQRRRFSTVPALAVLLSACVTVNVYFPAAAAQQAADQIIDRVTGQSGSAAPQSSAPGAPGAPTAPPRAPESSPQGKPAQPPTVPPTSYVAPAWALSALERVIDVAIPPAEAQAGANLDISTPEIRAITSSMQQRFAQLAPFFSSGAVGMTADGLVTERDLNAVPLAQRALVARLVAEDNRDRNALYAAIARANGHPEWEPDIRRTFARRWVERGAQSGWYYQDSGGAWQRK